MNRRLVVDLLLAGVLGTAAQIELWWYDGGPAGEPVVTAASSAVFAALLALRSSRPDLLLPLAAVVMVSQVMLGGRMTSTLAIALTCMLLVFSTGVLLPRSRAMAGAATLLLAAWFDLAATESRDVSLLSDLVFVSILVVGAPLLAGVALRDHRVRAEHLAQLNADLVAERRVSARLAALDERARIAREIHDVVAHSVSLMVVQAGAARHLLDRDPAQSRVALASVESVGREALRELRGTLGVLRDDDDATPELAPQPGLAQLQDLVATVGGSLDVVLELRAGERELGPTADVAAYRIVQEALTNALKHAPGATVRVTVTGDRDGVGLVIADDGPGPRADGAGHGLRGMRERAEIHGGRLVACPGECGGFRVEAWLPYSIAG